VHTSDRDSHWDACARLYAAAQEMELLGMTEDGRLVLWDRGECFRSASSNIGGISRAGAGSMMGISCSIGSDRRWSRISATSWMAASP
jgi:hypothetical protein